MEEVSEVKKSLKDLRSELKTHRASSTMPVSKLSRASIMAELSKYTPAVKPSPKVEQRIDEAVEQLRKKKPTNSKVKVVEEVKVEPFSGRQEPKPTKPKAKAEPKAEPKAESKPKKPLTEYQKLWGEARRKGMSPKEASDFAKSKLA